MIRSDLLNFERPTQQDGQRCHGAAAQREHQATGQVRTVRQSDGNVEIECIENPHRAEERGQDGAQGRDPAPAATQTAATAVAWRPLALRRLHGALLTSPRPPQRVRVPHRQLHALWRRAYQRPTLIHSGVQIGGFWAPPRCVCAVGNVSLRGRSWKADAVFRHGVQVVRCDDGTGKSLIQLPLLRLICSGLLWEVGGGGLLVAGSRACSNQSTN